MAFKLTAALILSAIASMVTAAPAAPATPAAPAEHVAEHITNVTERSTTYSGQGTYFNPGLGACGWTNGNNDYIVAVSSSLYANTKGICGKHLTANYKGKSVTVEVVDKCPGCGYYDLDFSPAAFEKLAPLSTGRLYGVSWHFD